MNLDDNHQIQPSECRAALLEFIREKKLSGNELLVCNELRVAFNSRRRVTWNDLKTTDWPDATYTKVNTAIDGVTKKAAEWSLNVPLQIIINRDSNHKSKASWSLSFNRNNSVTSRHSFQWTYADYTGSLPVRVLMAQDESIEVHLAPIDPWHFPRDLEDMNEYETRRKACWATYRNKRSEVKRPLPKNSTHWHVAEAHGPALNQLTGNQRVYLVVKQLTFKDYVATTIQLNELIPNTQKTHREWFKEQQKAFPIPHFPTANANILSVDVNVITKDGFLVLRQQEKNGPMETAIYAHINALEDVYRSDTHIPSPRETVFIWGCQLLGIHINSSAIKWLGVGLSSENGNVSLLGEVEVPLKYDELLERFKGRTDRGRSYALKKDPLKFDPKLVTDWLKESVPQGQQRRHLMEAAVILSLRRRYNRQITVTSTRVAETVRGNGQ